MSPIQEAPEVNSNNNEVFEVPVNVNPVMVLMGQLDVLKKNREQVEAHMAAIEARLQENTHTAKKRRMLINTNRVTGSTRVDFERELNNTLDQLRNELEFLNREIEQLQMQLGEQEFIERERTRAAAATATRKGGRSTRSARPRSTRRRPAHRRKPRA
jgi:septal ring factor EnvC (AmiA/AmiB activator)